MRRQPERHGWLPRLVIAMTLAAGGIILLGFWRLEEYLLDRTGRTLQWAAMEIAEKLDLVLFERYGDIQILAETLPEARGEQEGTQWTKHLQKVQKAYPIYGWIGLLDKTGRVVAATDSGTVGKEVGSIGLAGQTQGKSTATVHDARSHDLWEGYKTVGFSAPVAVPPQSRRFSPFHGALVTYIKLSDLEEIVTRTLQEITTKTDVHQRLEYQVLNRHGQVIVESLHQQEDSLDLVALGVQSARLVTEGQTGFVMEDHARRPVQVLTGYAPMPLRKELQELGWGILVRAESEAILAPIRSTIWNVVMWGMGIFLPLWLFLLWTMGRLRAEWRQTEVAQQESQEAQKLLQSILDNALDAHVLMDQEGLVVGWNRKAEAIFGWSSEEAVGKPLGDLIISPGYREPHGRDLRNLPSTGKEFLREKRFETEGWDREGHPFPIEISVAAIERPSGCLSSAFVRDITQRKQEERRRDAELHISKLLLGATSLDTVAQDVMKTICDVLDWKVGVLWRVDEEMQVLRYVTDWKTSGAQAEMFLEQTRRSNFARGIGLSGNVWASGKVEWKSDITSESNFPRASFAEKEGFRTAFAFPIKLEGNVQAVMEFFSDAVRPPDQQMLRLFDTVATKVSWFLSRQTIERHLRISEARLSDILNLAADAVVTVNDSQRIVLFNQGAERIFGYAAEEVLGQPLDSIIPDRFRGAPRHYVHAFASDSTAARTMHERTEVKGRRKSGEEFPAEASIARVTVEGQTTYTAILRDISQRKEEEQSLRAAKALAEQSAFQKAAVMASVEAFFIGISETGAVFEWAGQAEKFFGISLMEASGRPIQDLSIGWNREAIQEAISRATNTIRAVRLEKVRVVTHENREQFLKMTVSPLCKDTGVDVIIMGEDITGRLDLERELAQAQKLESIGHLAAGIAHEINTPTQFVGDNVHFLADSFADLHTVLARYRELLASAKTGACAPDLIEACELELQRADLDYLTEEIPKAIMQSNEGVERIARIVRAMKDFAHPGSEEKVCVDLNKAIGSTVEVSRNEWKYVADLTTDLAPDLPLVPCLQGQFNQVILNLIVNAAHAIGDRIKSTGPKGIISIMSRRIDDRAEIRITDNGSGIPEDIRHKIFDPFFTTKEVGKGTGQGLAIARSVVVDKHRGTITVESQVGQGTTFIIRLPLNGSGETGAMEQAA